MGGKTKRGDFVISEIAKWAILRGRQRGDGQKMTIMTNDSF